MAGQGDLSTFGHLNGSGEVLFWCGGMVKVPRGMKPFDPDAGIKNFYVNLWGKITRYLKNTIRLSVLTFSAMQGQLHHR